MNKIQCVEDRSSFTIRLGGKNSIDAEIYYKIIQNTISLIKTSAALTTPEAYLKLEVEANSQGSFLTSLAILIKENETLLYYGKETLEIAATVLGAVCYWLKIKEHSKGSKLKTFNIKDSNFVIIVNKDGDKLEIPKETSDKFFENKMIDSFISNLFEQINKEERTSFEIIPDKKSKLTPVIIKNSDFDNMAKPIIGEELVKHVVQPPIKVNLLIKQPDFISDSLWGFIYNKSIKARMKDKIFLERIRTGEIKLGAGYELNCFLQLEYDIEKEEIKKDTEKYTVLEVFDVIEPKQQTLF